MDQKETDQHPIVITDLPNDLIISVLSRLTIKEAVSTSLVKRNWRCLWTQLWSTVLNFNGWDILSPSSNSEEQKDPFRQQGFVKFVNQVLENHQGKTIEEFKICYKLDKCFAHEINRWVKFAFQKGVEVFELDFTNVHRSQPSITLPLIDVKSFNRLKELCLKYVDVVQEDLEYFLANFPSLEILHVKVSNRLFGLRVIGPSLSLKHFELCDCRNIKDLEIIAPHLVSFTYTGCKCERLNITCAPSLANLLLGIYVGQHGLIEECRPFHCCFNQLETLEFKDLELNGLEGGFPIPNLPKLKKLIVHVSAKDYEVALCLLPLIEAAPALHEFRMMLDARRTSRGNRLMFRGTSHPHQCLKVVEIVGFIGREIDMEFVLCMFDLAVSLEKMILDCRHPATIGTSYEFVETFEMGTARKCAELMRRSAPAGVDLLIR